MESNSKPTRRRSPNKRSRKRSPRRRSPRKASSPAKYVAPGGKVKFYEPDCQTAFPFVRL